MREILFKAKRLDNGEWVEGYYVKTRLGTDIKPSDVIFVPCSVELFFTVTGEPSIPVSYIVKLSTDMALFKA